MLVTIQRESVALIDQNKIGARRLTMAVVASVEGAMLQERPDVTRTMIQELKSSSLVEGFTIYRRNGVEAFTDLAVRATSVAVARSVNRSEEHTSELQSRENLVCRLLLEKKKTKKKKQE